MRTRGGVILTIGLLLLLVSGGVVARHKGGLFLSIIGSHDTREAAMRMVGQANRAGLNARVLNSTDYPGLRPGYWIVVVGQYDNMGQAQRMADEARRRGFRGAYAKWAQ